MSINTNYRPQLIVGLVLAIWLYFFLVLVGPFDASELSVRIRVILMVGYGLVFFLSYAVIIPIQNKIYSYKGKWDLSSELIIVFLFCSLCMPLTFAYYKSKLVNGTMTFEGFAQNIYLPMIAILIPVIFLGRYLVARHGNGGIAAKNNNPTITLMGENKLDILNLPMSHLVALEAASNYVAVYYMIDGQLQKKLLRTSLRKIHNSVPEMVQVHRSYLVNSQHFIEWKDGLTLSMTQLFVPVSQKYKSTLLATSAFVPK